VSPPALLEVVSSGPLSSVQDLGRHGFRRYGVPTSGALDPALLRVANALAGAPEESPGLEFHVVGPALRAAEGAVRLGLAGDVAAQLERGERRRALGSWRSVTLEPGDVLRVGPVREGRVGYIAIPGLEADRLLASASTYLRGGFGGLGGRPLRAGTVMVVSASPGGRERALPVPPLRAALPFRAVPGPQDDHFTEQAVATLFGSEYLVTPASDRMGMRLEGPRLAHRTGADAEIVSDAVLPGAIQVPGNGLPIVLLADAQTIGGYPKVATVASADLPRLATLRPGARVRFSRITVAEAEALARARDTEIRMLIASIRALPEPPR
jgi:5-oxoprolinase (ATP-hydrolysing) subunit C